MHYYMIPVGSYGANCSVVWTDESDHAWIIDPGAEAERIAQFCANRKLVPTKILLTHGHFDHMCAVGPLKEKFPLVQIYITPEDDAWAWTAKNSSRGYIPGARPADVQAKLKDQMRLQEGKIKNFACEVLATPGHTAGSVCFYFQQAGLLFAGDTLFMDGHGRTDMWTSNEEDLDNSLAYVITLPPETVVITGHGETTTIGREKGLSFPLQQALRRHAFRQRFLKNARKMPHEE